MERIERQDIVATLKFAVVTFVVLPVLPREPYNFGLEFDVFNAHKTWLMVILISGSSFAGYVLVKLVGALYALIVFLVKAAEHYIESTAIYLVSVLSGLTDVDAITLSVSEAANSGLSHVVAVRAIIIAVISNTFTKGALAFGLGSGLLRRHVGIAFGLAFAAGVVSLFFVK